MSRLVLCLTILPSLPAIVTAQSIVDVESPLETIATEFGLADGPAWNGWSLDFPDVKGGKLFRYNPKTGKTQVLADEAGRISASFFSQGKLYLSNNGEGRITLQGKEPQPLTEAEGSGRDLARPNDLGVDKNGGIYWTLTRQGRVMYRQPDGPVVTAVEKIETPNGITLSPDETTLFVSAYVPKQIYSYNVVEPGTTGGGRLFSTMDDGEAKGADGMTIDRAGNVYCAGATDVWIWNPSGRLLAKIVCPTRPINCTFGDSDLRSLYITGFGGLYRQRMKAYGVPARLPLTDIRNEEQKTTRPSIAVPDNVRLLQDVVYRVAGERRLLCDICLPRLAEGETGPRPAVVVVHGGGWLNGDRSKFRALALQLAARGYVTAAIDYRLGHEARFPAGIHACNAAIQFLRLNADRYIIDPDRIGAIGGSAGGHLVGLMATGSRDVRLQSDDSFLAGSTKLQAAIVMAGPMQMTTGSVAEKSRKGTANANVWLGKTIDEDPELYALSDAHLHISDASPPILFMTGEHDNPKRNQPSRDKLKAAGVWTDIKVYKDGKHGCWNRLPWFNTMLDDMDEFFKEHLKKDS